MTRKQFGSFIDKLKGVGAEQLLTHGPWFFLCCWLLMTGVPQLIDRVTEGYEKIKTEIVHSLDRLSDSIDRNIEEQKRLQKLVSEKDSK